MKCLPEITVKLLHKQLSIASRRNYCVYLYEIIPLSIFRKYYPKPKDEFWMSGHLTHFLAVIKIRGHLNKLYKDLKDYGVFTNYSNVHA